MLSKVSLQSIDQSLGCLLERALERDAHKAVAVLTWSATRFDVWRWEWCFAPSWKVRVEDEEAAMKQAWGEMRGVLWRRRKRSLSR